MNLGHLFDVKKFKFFISDLKESGKITQKKVEEKFYLGPYFYSPLNDKSIYVSM